MSYHSAKHFVFGIGIEHVHNVRGKVQNLESSRVEMRINNDTNQRLISTDTWTNRQTHRQTQTGSVGPKDTQGLHHPTTSHLRNKTCMQMKSEKTTTLLTITR